MDIKEMVRIQLLREEAKAKLLGCVMVFLDYDKDEWKKLQDDIDEEDLFVNPLVGYSKEKTPHVTILYGLHNDIGHKAVEEEVKKIKMPSVKLGEVSTFSNNKRDFDVLKFDIISEDLHELNKVFKKFPFTNDFPKYEAHCTIAYIKKGKADKYIEKLNKLAKIEVEPKEIVYSKANGDKFIHELHK